MSHKVWPPIVLLESSHVSFTRSCIVTIVMGGWVDGWMNEFEICLLHYSVCIICDFIVRIYCVLFLTLSIP